MGKPLTQEHKDKIAAALRRYNVAGGHLGAYHKAGPEHPNWKGGTAPRYYQRIAYEAYGHACQRCGATGSLIVHHRDRNRQNGSVENLEVLCKSCHGREHERGGDVRHTTHCPQGHAYTAENTAYHTTKRGYRVRSCRECRRAVCRRWYWRQKEIAS